MKQIHVPIFDVSLGKLISNYPVDNDAGIVNSIRYWYTMKNCHPKVSDFDTVTKEDKKTVGSICGCIPIRGTKRSNTKEKAIRHFITQILKLPIDASQTDQQKSKESKLGFDFGYRFIHFVTWKHWTESSINSIQRHHHMFSREIPQSNFCFVGERQKNDASVCSRHTIKLYDNETKTIPDMRKEALDQHVRQCLDKRLVDGETPSDDDEEKKKKAKWHSLLSTNPTNRMALDMKTWTEVHPFFSNFRYSSSDSATGPSVIEVTSEDINGLPAKYKKWYIEYVSGSLNEDNQNKLRIFISDSLKRMYSLYSNISADLVFFQLSSCWDFREMIKFVTNPPPIRVGPGHPDKLPWSQMHQDRYLSIRQRIMFVTESKKNSRPLLLVNLKNTNGTVNREESKKFLSQFPMCSADNALSVAIVDGVKDTESFIRKASRDFFFPSESVLPNMGEPITNDNMYKWAKDILDQRRLNNMSLHVST